jgi:predicted transcriptional regulator
MPPVILEARDVIGNGRYLQEDYKNVSTDVALLERLGLVRLEAKGGKGRAQTPTVPYDEIQVTIDLRQPYEAHAA